MDQLVVHLEKYGYRPSTHAPNIWSHDKYRTKFCLCVDEFGEKFFDKEEAQHLINALRAAFDITIYWTSSKFCDLELDWDYSRKYVDVAMPDSVRNYSISNRRNPNMHHIVGLIGNMVRVRN